MAKTKTAGPHEDTALRRLGGGRWETRDGRFTIEPQSGTWVVIDAEQADELGLLLVRGPFGSLTAAKAAITAARSSLPAESSLEARAVAIRTRDASALAAPAGSPASSVTALSPPEPTWIAELAPAERRRARRLIDRLTAAGAVDAEGIARRDIVGDVSATAAFAVSRAINELGASATPARLARLLADGSDEDLGVRWRLVDGDGRGITLEISPEAPSR